MGGTHRADDSLVSRGLLARARNGAAPTVAGVLTLGTDPQQFLPEARIRLLRYQGTGRETGERSNIVSDVEGTGALRDQIAFARRTLRRWLGAAVRLGPGGRFRPTSLIPEDAWLEAVVNAVVHRSYSMGGDHIRISLFADRLEVESPGRLPGLVRIETIRTTRFARSPRVARTVLELGYGRELGEGVDRMFEEMQRVGLPDRVYRQGPASVTVTLLMDPIGARMLRHLPSGSERFVEFVLGSERVTTAQAKELLGVSVNTARRYLTALADAGYLRHESKSARDPHGYWPLISGQTVLDGHPLVGEGDLDRGHELLVRWPRSQRDHPVGPLALHPVDGGIGGGQDDREIHVQLTELGHEVAPRVGVAGHPGVIDEDVSAVHERAGQVHDNRTRLLFRAAATLGFVAGAMQLGDHVRGDRLVALDDEDASHALASLPGIVHGAAGTHTRATGPQRRL